MSLEEKTIRYPAKNKNTDLYLKAIPGHFITNHSHINYYTDMTEMKSIYRVARKAAKVLSQKYNGKIPVETILCLDGTEVIGAMLARDLRESHFGPGTHAKKDIAVITPEQNNNTSQLIFRDNYKPLIRNRDCIALVSSVTTGYTVHKAIETIAYYGGVVRGVSAIFSKVNHVDGVPIDAIFDITTIPDYRSYDYTNCPFCKQGIKVDALVNTNGYSIL